MHQSFAGIGDACRKHGTLFLADTVCSLGGVPFFGNAMGVDAMYSGSQKALSAPPGAAPLMLGERAFEKLSNRKTPVASYMNDLTLIGDYWGWYDKRFYHHTGMVSMTYAMREALEVVKVRFCPVTVAGVATACAGTRHPVNRRHLRACPSGLFRAAAGSVDFVAPAALLTCTPKRTACSAGRAVMLVSFDRSPAPGAVDRHFTNQPPIA